MSTEKAISILFLAPSPNDEAILRLGEELREIQDRLDKNKFDLKSRHAVRPKDVISTIVDLKPQVVHFSGHGMESGELCLEDDQGNSQPVRPDALASLFRLVSKDVKCVVINTCFSEPQAKAIAEHIPFVIGMKEMIPDKAAIEFAYGFYTGIEADQSIDKIEQAFELGRVQIQMSGFATEHLIPTLIYGDPRRRFRAEVEQAKSKLQKTDSVSAKIFHRALLEKGRRMNLSAEQSESIINEILELIKDFKFNVEKYANAYKEALKFEFPVEEGTREALQFLSLELGLQNEVESIEHEINSDTRWQKPEAFFRRAIANNGLSEYQKAIKYATKAIEIRPNYSAAYHERGQANLRAQNLEEAIADYSQAIEKNSYWEDQNLGNAYFDRGLAYFDLAEATKENQSENLQKAAIDWTEVLKLRSDYSAAFYNRALAYIALDKGEDAIKDLTSAIETNTDWGGASEADAYNRRYLLYLAAGKNREASQDLRKWQELTQ